MTFLMKFFMFCIPTRKKLELKGKYEYHKEMLILSA